MDDQGQWITGVLSMARISFETTMRSMDILRRSILICGNRQEIHNFVD